MPQIDKVTFFFTTESFFCFFLILSIFIMFFSKLTMFASVLYSYGRRFFFRVFSRTLLVTLVEEKLFGINAF